MKQYSQHIFILLFSALLDNFFITMLNNSSFHCKKGFTTHYFYVHLDKPKAHTYVHTHPNFHAYAEQGSAEFRIHFM